MSSPSPESLFRRHVFSRRILAGIAFLAILVSGCQVFILWTGNFRVVVPGKVYRSAQPEPEQLEGWIDSHGIKTVVNLRGHVAGVTEAEYEVVREKDVDFYVFDTFSAYQLPGRPALLNLIETIETAETPMLIHCRQGIDRSGTASVIAEMAIGGEDYSQARWQGFVLPGPWKRKYDNEHISDLYGMYEQYCEQNDVDMNAFATFKQWAYGHYRPHYYYVNITTPEELVMQPGESRKVEVAIHNTSGQMIPAGDPEKQFYLITYHEYEDDGDTKRPVWEPMTSLPGEDFADGAVIKLAHTIVAPEKEGAQVIYFDLLEKNITRFGRQKSPTPSCRLVIEREQTNDHASHL